MITRITITALLITILACKKEEVKLNTHDIKISVEAGKNFTHNFDIGMGLTIPTTPQMAVWIEDSAGNYITTLFVTHKIACQRWQNNNGNPRIEALPWWGYKSGFAIALSRSKLADAAMNKYTIPDDVVADAVTGATPTESFNIKFSPSNQLSVINLMFEVNNSTDFNDYYNKNAVKGTPQYSGGTDGSGQPALVYGVMLKLKNGATTTTMQLLGHSSPDGIKKTLYPDLTNVTSAKEIIKQVIVEVK